MGFENFPSLAVSNSFKFTLLLCSASREFTEEGKRKLSNCSREVEI